MTGHYHHREIARRQVYTALRGIPCPVCGIDDLFHYGPDKRRPWHVAGCDSRLCNSSWRIMADSMEQLKLILK